MATPTPAERAEDLPEPPARRRVRELREETALLTGQPTFETPGRRRRRHAELRAQMRELCALEQRLAGGR